jgi:hypothetical protein
MLRLIIKAEFFTMKIHEITEAASAGASSSGGIAVVIQAHAKIPKDKNGIPKAPQILNPNGTVKNALDLPDNIMGSLVKRV